MTSNPRKSMPEIRANSILPAHRTPLELRTVDGLRLIGELALPVDQSPVATVVCLHPLPTHGGMMDSHVFRKAAWRLPALSGVAVLRFNTRGTSSADGTSEGTFDAARGEGYDLAAALDHVDRAGLPPPWLLGWSFGTDIALLHGRDPRVVGAILLSPPLRFAGDEELLAWAATERPLLVVVPEFDDYLPPLSARRRFAIVPTAEVIEVAGAKHLWVGGRFVDRALNEIVRRVAPDSFPLPQHWDGLMATANDLAPL
jgi:uncharacterized protein